MNKKQKKYLLFLIALSISFALFLSYIILDNLFNKNDYSSSAVALLLGVIPSILAALVAFLMFYIFIERFGLFDYEHGNTSQYFLEIDKKILALSEGMNPLNDDDFADLLGTWLYILDPKKSVDVYGVISIIYDGDKIRAYGDAWYFGGKPAQETRRGTWDSFQFCYDKYLKRATALYSMNIINGTEVEADLNMIDYIGLLTFSLRGSQFFGNISSIGGKDKKEGYCKGVKLTSEAFFKHNRANYENMDVVNSFQELLGVNILEQR